MVDTLQATGSNKIGRVVRCITCAALLPINLLIIPLAPVVP